VKLIEVNIPGRRKYRVNYLVLDLNGTIALDGSIIDGVEERLQALSKLVDISVVTADTLGRAQGLAKSLGVKIHKVDAGEEKAQKLKFVKRLGSESTVSIGNGSNDVSMLKEAILGICVVGPEAASVEAVASCDLVAPNINAALDLLLKPARLIATLRE
jgi:P-type E1-E2 ATPase